MTRKKKKQNNKKRKERRAKERKKYGSENKQEIATQREGKGEREKRKEEGGEGGPLFSTPHQTARIQTAATHNSHSCASKGRCC